MKDKVIKMEVELKHLKTDVGKMDTKITLIKKFLFSEDGRDGLTEKMDKYYARKTDVAFFKKITWFILTIIIAEAIYIIVNSFK